MNDDDIKRGSAALDKITEKKRRRNGLQLVKSETFDAEGKRVIRHEPGRLPQVLDQVGLALAEHGANIFYQNNRLVHIYPAPELNRGGVHRPGGTLILHPIDSPHLSELATAAAIHEKWDERSASWKRCDCPRRIGDNFLSRGHWPELRQLTGFIEAPTITPDGRLIEQHGYDDATGLFLCANIPSWRAPALKPSAEEAKSAFAFIQEALREFPFVAAEDLVAAVAGIMTGLLRRVLPAAPLLAITAPTPGTGKTLIAETIAVIATGRRASVLSLGHDEAEAEKRVAGMLLAAYLVIALDNIERPLKGDLLCQVLTQPLVQLRPLGGSGMLSIPTHALLVATGNNLSIVGDLKRRTMLIRLDAGQERPETRTFKHDHLEDVIFARRGELIRAALTIPLAYLAAGAPAIEGLHPFGGFEQWDRLVRRPLLWLGEADPLKASEGLREQDPELEGMRLLLSAWRATFGDEPKTAAEIVDAGMAGGYMAGDYIHPDLRDALQLVCSEKPNTRRLGYWLRAHRDRIVDGLQVKQAGVDGLSKVTRWRISRCL